MRRLVAIVRWRTSARAARTGVGRRRAQARSQAKGFGEAGGKGEKEEGRRGDRGGRARAPEEAREEVPTGRVGKRAAGGRHRAGFEP